MAKKTKQAAAQPAAKAPITKKAALEFLRGVEKEIYSKKREKADFFIELYPVRNDRNVSKMTWFSPTSGIASSPATAPNQVSTIVSPKGDVTPRWIGIK